MAAGPKNKESTESGCHWRLVRQWHPWSCQVLLKTLDQGDAAARVDDNSAIVAGAIYAAFFIVLSSSRREACFSLSVAGVDFGSFMPFLPPPLQ